MYLRAGGEIFAASFTFVDDSDFGELGLVTTVGGEDEFRFEVGDFGWSATDLACFSSA